MDLKTDFRKELFEHYKILYIFNIVLLFLKNFTQVYFSIDF